MTTDVRALITSVESYFLSGMFGDGKAIAGNVAAYYRGAARACASACGIDPTLVTQSDSPHIESLRRVYVDEVLRYCMAERLDEGKTTLREYLSLRERAMTDPPPGGVSNGPSFFDANAEHWFGRLLIQRLNITAPLNKESVNYLPVEVSAEIEVMHGRAVALAQRSLPRLADDVFQAVPHSVLYRAPEPYSTFINTAPLFIFLSERMFEDAHFAAELLVHECLHQKLNDISAVRSLFRPDYDDSQSAKVKVPWSFGGNKTRYFSADRTFAAFHVYAHQTLLYLGMTETASTPDETEIAMRNVVLSWARAAHFSLAVQDDQIRAEFGPDGYRFAAWLTRALDDLGHVRLPDGSLLHTHVGEYSSPETAAHLSPPRRRGQDILRGGLHE